MANSIIDMRIVHLAAQLKKHRRFRLASLITCVLGIVLLATAIQWSPLTEEKYRLAFSTQSVHAYTHMLSQAQALGDSAFVHNLFASLPNASQHDLRTLAYPQEPVEKQLVFWANVLQKQPTSREALAAVTILNYELRRNEEAKTHLAQWKLVEPNDTRIPLVEHALNL